MGFFGNWLDELNEITNKKKKEDLEKEMNAYELEEWQKDLVRKGEYNSNNFEDTDDELEDEDYYEEDS